MPQAKGSVQVEPTPNHTIDTTLNVEPVEDVDEPTGVLDAAKQRMTNWANRRKTDAVERQLEAAQSFGAKAIGKGLATVAITVVVLNTIFTIDAIANSTGPFGDVITTLTSIGGSALTLIVVGFLALAGSVAMRYMDRF